MTHKKILLVSFFLCLFMLRQVQVEAKFLPSHINEIQPLVVNNSIQIQFSVTVARLDENDRPITFNGEIVKCFQFDTSYGCGEGGSGYPYIQNPITINIEEYLLDVLPREMDVASNSSSLESLQSQAVAARSYAAYRNPTNNSVEFMIFIPNSYELYHPPSTSLIGNAITSTQGQYLSLSGSTIDAQFASDSINRTTTCLNADLTQCYSYLVEVEDPISAWQLGDSRCDANNNGNSIVDNPDTPNIDEKGKVWGMSQKGAIRWSIGNQCVPQGVTTYPWPVKWEDYRQILVHYYTGIDILNASGNPVAPDNRWNLLNFNDNQPISMVSGQTYNNISAHLQNTSTFDWSDSQMMLGYRWSETQAWTDLGTIPALIKGGDTTIDISIPAPPTGGTHTLHLDIRYANISNSWFSNSNWPDAEITVSVDGPTATATFTPTQSTPLPTPAEGDWIYLGTWENIGCNTEISFPAVTAKQFKMKMLAGGGWDNRISFYGLGSSGAAWLANGSWQEVNNQTYDLYTGQERETNIFEPAIVSQQRFSVGCNDGETMTVEVYYRITYGSTPTLAPYPTTTLTVAPTPSEPCDCPINFLFLDELYCYIFGSNTAKVAMPIKLLQSFQQVSGNIELYHRVEDEILSQTLEGQHYIDFYYENGHEIIQILYNNPDLKEEAIEVLQMWEPNLQALVDGQGDTVTITNAQVQAVQDFLDNLSAEASTELQQVIANEQIQQPLEQLIGVTMDEALEYVEDGVSETATPTFTPSPTPTFTPSPTVTNAVTPTGTASPVVHTLVLQPNSSGGVDTYLLSTSATSNYGSSSDMGIGESNNSSNRYTRSLIKFDLSSLPFDAQIVSATLSLWTSNDLASNDANIDVYRLKVPFVENQATWNRSASGTNWQTAGANGANDRESDAIGSVQIAHNQSLNTEKQIVLDPAKIQEMFDGTFTNNGFLLKTDAELNDRFDFKTSDTSTSSQRPKLVIEFTAESIPEGFLFGDGFESGNFNAWDDADTDGGDLSVTTQAAAVGSYGMQAVIDDDNEIGVEDESPNNEAHYSARFYLHPNSVQMPNAESMYILIGNSKPNYWWVFCVSIKRMGELYTLALCGNDDEDEWLDGKEIYITNDWQAVEVEWKAASSPSVHDGYLKLYINDVLVDTISNIDNDDARITDVSLGLLSDIPENASGTVYFDAFESRQGQYIGLDENGPTLSPPLDLVFMDDFEGNDFSLWDYAFSGNDLSISSGAAMFGSYGMQVVINDTSIVDVETYVPADETQYRARFYFDPNSITIPNNNGFSIMSAGGGGSAFRLMLNRSGGTYKLQAQPYNDAGSSVSGQQITLSDEPHVIEIAFQAASASGANNGSFQVWIDDTLVDTIANLDNDTRKISYVSLGATGSIDNGTSGTIFFDEFVSRRESYIGPIQQ